MILLNLIAFKIFCTIASAFPPTSIDIHGTTAESTLVSIRPTNSTTTSPIALCQTKLIPEKEGMNCYFNETTEDYLTCQFTGLKPKTNYQAQARCCSTAPPEPSCGDWGAMNFTTQLPSTPELYMPCYTVDQIKNGSATVSFCNPTSGIRVDYYRALIVMGNPQQKCEVFQGPTTVAKCIIENLKEYTKYEVTFEACVKKETGVSCGTQTKMSFTTLIAVHLCLSVDTPNPNTLDLGICNISKNPLVNMYMVHIYSPGNAPCTIHVSQGHLKCTFKNLNAGTSYHAVVYACSNNTDDCSGQNIWKVTTMPSKPKIFQIDLWPSRGEIVVTLSPPDGNPALAGYNVRIRNDLSSQFCHMYADGHKKKSCTISGLEIDKPYEVGAQTCIFDTFNIPKCSPWVSYPHKIVLPGNAITANVAKSLAVDSNPITTTAATSTTSSAFLERPHDKNFFEVLPKTSTADATTITTVEPTTAKTTASSTTSSAIFTRPHRTIFFAVGAIRALTI